MFSVSINSTPVFVEDDGVDVHIPMPGEGGVDNCIYCGSQVELRGDGVWVHCDSEHTHCDPAPHIEVFYRSGSDHIEGIWRQMAGDLQSDCPEMSYAEIRDQMEGWYWWSCVPGCLPDSDPIGPFDSDTEAEDDAHDSDRAEPERHWWCNSAGISIGGDSDRVTVSISVGDPRGAFTMYIERMSDGELRLSVPHPEDSLAHAQLTELASPGHYKIG